jgi:hypothetical protein
LPCFTGVPSGAPIGGIAAQMQTASDVWFWFEPIADDHVDDMNPV